MLDTLSMAIQLEIVRFRLLLVCFGWGPFGFLVVRIFGSQMHTMACSLSFHGPLFVEGSRITVGTSVIEVFLIDAFRAFAVVAKNMLPSVAFLAIDRASIILGDVTDTLDYACIIFLLWLRLFRLFESDRRQGWYLFCHNLLASRGA